MGNERMKCKWKGGGNNVKWQKCGKWKMVKRAAEQMQRRGVEETANFSITLNPRTKVLSTHR